MNGYTGKVIDFTLFNTVILDNSAKVPISIPNNNILSDVLINYSKIY